MKKKKENGIVVKEEKKSRTPRNIGRTNKNKGNQAEREFAQRFRSLGFSFCKTSRAASKLYDDSGIDLVFLPYNIQIKAGYNRGLNYSSILSYMEGEIIKNFPPNHEVHNNPNIVIHKKNSKSGLKRDKNSELVVMSWEDFSKMAKLCETINKNEK